MSEDSQIVKTTKEDLKRFENLLVGNSVRSMRIVFNRIKRRMVIFESRLTELYMNEKIIKARIYNNADAIKIHTEYIAGKGKKNIPVQSFQSINIAPTPHQNVSYDKFNILTTEEGIRKLDSELNRINSEILDIQAVLELYEEKYEIIKEELKKAEEDKEKRSKIGRFFSPTQEDLDADQIAQAKTAHILLLLGISEQFRNLITPFLLDQTQAQGKTYAEFLESMESDAVVGYPDGDRRTTKQLEVYQQLFWAHGHTKGLTVKDPETGEEVPLSTYLNFDNPGDTRNLEVLNEYVKGNRLAAINSKMSLQVDRYIRDVDSVIADPLISRGVEIQPDVSIPVTESMRMKTISYPTSVLRVGSIQDGDFYAGSFEMPSLFEMVRKRWKKRQARLYFGLPVCPYAKPSGTSTDIKEEALEISLEERVAAATAKYSEKLKEAEDFVAETVEISMGDLPDSAKEWVKIYVKRFEKAARGLIVYEGNQVAILRGTSEESAVLAKERANRMTTFPPGEEMEEKDDYFYESTYGYEIKIGNEDIFVSVEEKEKMEEKDDQGRYKIPARLGKQKTEKIRATFESGKETERKEFVAYVMWGKK
jgi:hypothetical protein